MDLEMPLPPQLSHTLSSNDADSLRELGLLDFLEHDPRPTFVLDITDARDSFIRLKFVYGNTALATAGSGSLQDAITGIDITADIIGEDAASFSQFRYWSYHQGSTSSESIPFCNYSWRRCLIAKRWVVISGTSIESSILDEELKADGGILSKKSSRPNFATFDWTDDPPPVKLSSHVAWARSIDWASTPLGPMRGWSPQLRSNASLIMQDPRPAVGFYGPELIMIYNEPYIELLGGLHPCMGRSARVVLASVWDDYFEPIIERNKAGETVDNSYTELPLKRNGYVEETYFSTRFIPIFNSEGATIGHYEPVVEITKEVILERRSRTLLELSQELPRAHDPDAYWEHAVQVFSRNNKDVPFALFYSTEMDSNSGDSTGTNKAADSLHQCGLRRSIGILEEPSAGLQRLDLRQDHGIIKLFKQAAIADKPITIDLTENSEASQLAKGLQPQSSGVVCKVAVICPLHPLSSKETILGFMVLGLNPRRPYDEEYSQFVHVAARLVSTSLTSMVSHQEDIGRRERAITTAELIKSELRQQLVESQKEADRGHSKFQRFAERSNIGIFIVNMEGIFSYQNEAWYDILSPDDRDIALDEAWRELVDEEYIPLGQAKFEALAVTKEPQSFELRLKNTWCTTTSRIDDSLPEQQRKWVLCSIFPELSEEGEILEIIGCITEISQQKWGEQLQAMQATRAKESKRQLESFIDTTSHEMRNPLSAIIQCADSIISSYKTLQQSTCDENYQRTLLAAVDSAETIVQCSKHMKTIVDDVLTISKLDSGLFAMTPIDVQLESTAQDAVKMFEGEAKSAGVDLQFHIDDSCRELGVVNVSLDPTRVLQVLINLLTNAIKFTRLEAKRQILVSLSISLERPTHNADGRVAYIPRSGGSEAKTLQADWDQGQSVFVRFSVQDTGTGMTDAEHQLLFTRFSQTSPRTHIDYGGSGLGLFISRRLTEMHGGAIGFTSQKEVGSTFSFYVQSRKSNPTSLRRESVEESSAAVDLSLKTHKTVLRSKSYSEENTPHASRTNTPERTVPDSDLHILIVEDNLVNQRVLAKQLRNLGMHVAVANHGGEALKYLRTTNYCNADGSGNELNMILMDWEMPVMNGLECVANIRKMQGEGDVNGHVPVIVVTANVRSEQVEIALRAGMDDVISKPFRIPELRACIQKTLRNTAPAEHMTIG
ncbi:aerobic respiration control sensor protein-like protein arcB [Macroventuria anomochaeta]|uniref:Aerobic respiration control sensor protein-like protein arcB n=1 Tax=Macroventuria anomochaeta TaxID=301207 RepID=A0ACB6RV20_9PLEO|nr:aerobic respiration control sensor protein-like protein arcB [Macroventuria anomochaeta]KAF2625562.1 aerobic respiration control sensor protein-like protein arcB [Macroventuria anomochaeta]